MIADDFNQYGTDIGYANDVEYEIEGDEDEEEIDRQAEIAEYQRMADTNPYIFWEG